MGDRLARAHVPVQGAQVRRQRTWKVTLPVDPSSAPTVATPGTDVSHWFELAGDVNFTMDVCDPSSDPQLPCTPESDANAPACPSAASTCSPNSYPGAGSAQAEVQLYPPGEAPFVDAIGCDNSHWCAGLRVQSLECTEGFSSCNNNCEEPVNFAFIQTNGVPTGPPSPQDSDLASNEPNSDTLLMNPGDQITVQMFDAPVSGGGDALKAVIDDLTTHTSGYMQTSAANGFQNTSIVDCSGTPHSFQPEYSTASRANVIPWEPLQGDIATGADIGKFEPCTSVSGQLGDGSGGSGDPEYQSCTGPYESGNEGSEATDYPCFTAGDTHGSLNSAPNPIAGCLAAGGDLDFDGSSYWREWPTGTTATSKYPSSLVEAAPTSNGHQYSQWFAQTDVAFRSRAARARPYTRAATVPPPGPGHFYPYWSQHKTSSGARLSSATSRAAPG